MSAVAVREYIGGGKYKADELQPFDDLLADKEFWVNYEKVLATELTSVMFEPFLAGFVAGSKLKPAKEKAMPAADEVPDWIDPDDLARMAEEAITDYVPTFTKTISDATYSAVRDAVARSRREGSGVEGVLRDIQGLFSRGRAETIAVTETTRLFGLGAQASYKAQGFNAWKWMAANDPWVDATCAGLAADSDTKPFPMDKLFEPAHPRCRCFPSPVVSESQAPPSIFGGKFKDAEDFIRNADDGDIQTLYGLPGYRVEVEDTRMVGSKSRVARFSVVDAKSGRVVADSVRSFHLNGLEVHHDLLIVKEQGEGFAALFNAHADDAYRELGFKFVSLDADIDVGKYAWAKQGFTFAQEGKDRADILMRYKAAAARKIEGARGLSTADSRKRADELFANVNDAWDVAAIDDVLPNGSSWKYSFQTSQKSGDGNLGKAIMLQGGNWDGVRSLDPESPGQYIFDKYLREKGVR